MPLLAASYTWAVTRKTGVQSVPEPGICMVADWSSKAHWTDMSVGRQDRHFEQNCANVPIMSFRIKVDAD
jgi:hypothetical protein